MSATYVFQGYKNTYYFRIAISTDLRHIVKRGEIRRSLKTTNYATALRRAQQMYEELQTLFNQLRVQNGMHPFLGKGFEIEGLTVSKDGTVKIDKATTDPDNPEDAQQLAKFVKSVQEPQPAASTAVSEEASDNLLSVVQQRFLQDWKSRRSGIGLQPKTITAFNSCMDTLIEIVGDIPVETVTNNDAERFRDTMLQLPSRRKQRKPWKDMTIEQILKAVIPEKERLTPKSVHDSLQKITNFFNWCRTKRLIPYNPFEGVDVLYNRNSRSHIPEDVLKIIFGPKNYKIDRRKPSHYFAPLIALHTGMRRGEIFFRTPNDIIQKDGIWCFNIHRDREAGINTKTTSSVRLVPIHKKLIELGFLDFVEKKRRKDPNGRLFPEYPDYSGQAGYKFSDHWSKYVKSLQIENTVFHQFRHTLTTELLRQGNDLTTIQLILGHSTGKLTLDVYSDGYTMKDRLAKLEKADFSSALQGVPIWKYCALPDV